MLFDVEPPDGPAAFFVYSIGKRNMSTVLRIR
jgi:hypothetical protein